MIEAVKIIAITSICAAVYLLLKAWQPAYAIVFAVFCAAAAALWLLGLASQLVSWLAGLQLLADAQAFHCLARAAGILICAEYARLLCRDAGLESLGVCVDVSGRVLILCTALPLFKAVSAAIERLMG